MESLKKLGTKCSGAFVSGLEFSKKAKRPSQEALEQNGIRVEILFNVHCSKCEKEFRKCCESMPGVSEVNIDDHYVHGSTKLATVTGVFDSEKLVRRIWKKCSKKVEIFKQAKIGAGGGNGSGADGEGNEQEEEEGQELEIKEDHDH
ncbi:hypothetical protein I3760_06G106400 [Carya illinoinensis]|uniref:HMA domain-containing protein n=1 Tax=Carya illinoinensis TaxID=32201 RepID=A0A8T1QA47_CARIL|nr:hypothetical protein I3760_06G106400 [Carya illinoinensis]KAG6651358.1 hypothetical protein CIPAW_06G105300 [Carya illinoinensis]